MLLTTLFLILPAEESASQPPTNDTLEDSDAQDPIGRHLRLSNYVSILISESDSIGKLFELSVTPLKVKNAI